MHCHYTHNKNQNNDPGTVVNGTTEEAYGASQISTKNSSWAGWALSRHPVVNQPTSALPTQQHRQQLVAVLALEQLCRHG